MNLELSEKLVTGKGRFTDDINLPGMIHLAFVRSPYARAKILKISGGLTSEDIALSVSSVGEGASEGFENLAHPVLAHKFVGYVGQPVAAVFSENQYEAEDMIDSVDIEYDPLKAVSDPEESINFEPIYPGLKSNTIVDKWYGSDFNPERSQIEIEDRFVNNRIATNPIEPRGVVAAYDGSKLTVWMGTQSVHIIRR